MFRSLLLIALALPASTALAQDSASGVPYDAKILPACRAETAAKDARSCIGKASAQCMESPDGYTTVGMVSCLGQELDQWDAMLNTTYAALIAQAAEADRELAELGSAASPAEPALRDAQRKWLAWREAECGFAASRFQGGTAGGPVASECALTLTAERVLALELFLGEER